MTFASEGGPDGLGTGGIGGDCGRTWSKLRKWQGWEEVSGVEAGVRVRVELGRSRRDDARDQEWEEDGSGRSWVGGGLGGLGEGNKNMYRITL